MAAKPQGAESIDCHRAGKRRRYRSRQISWQTSCAVGVANRTFTLCIEVMIGRGARSDWVSAMTSTSFVEYRNVKTRPAQWVVAQIDPFDCTHGQKIFCDNESACRFNG